MKMKKISRSAESGRFVSAEFAAANPKTTVKETVPTGKRESIAPDVPSDEVGFEKGGITGVDI